MAIPGSIFEESAGEFLELRSLIATVPAYLPRAGRSLQGVQVFQEQLQLIVVDLVMERRHHIAAMKDYRGYARIVCRSAARKVGSAKNSEQAWPVQPLRGVSGVAARTVFLIHVVAGSLFRRELADRFAGRQRGLASCYAKKSKESCRQEQTLHRTAALATR